MASITHRVDENENHVGGSIFYRLRHSHLNVCPAITIVIKKG